MIDRRQIDRRKLLGLFAAAGLLPTRSFADVAPPRSEIRESLAKHFAAFFCRTTLSLI